MSVDYNTIKGQLEACGQQHLLKCYDDLESSSQSTFLDQLSRIPWDSIPSLVEQYLKAQSCSLPRGDVAPADVTIPDPETAAALASRGEEIIRAGRVAAFTVAGGQGTRLGWTGPKGTYPATPVSGKPLFRVFAEQIEAASRRWDTPIRWYIMTSEANDAATRSFFADNNWFGLPRNQIMLFPQGMMPCLDVSDGKVLMESPGCVAMSPDGHGGSLGALRRSGAIEQMEMLGINTISYFQIDNPIAPVIDPVFIGLHADPERSSGEMSSKMVPKVRPDEKVGVFCTVGGHTEVIEYSDLPSSLQSETDAEGRLRYDAGNIAVHLLSVPFAKRLSEQNELPWHRAVKKVPCCDPTTGQELISEEPNGIKLEQFIFDALPLAVRSATLEVARSREFAPIKNATGPDSPESCRQAQCDLYGQWLEDNGVEVARDAEGHVLASIEISPLTAMHSGDLAGQELPARLDQGDRLVL
ncbi:MAG: UDPGP type 1 family protein [Phycisphaerales bacterium]|nr:UDPGP type 1 family protein [Phycisphaerales bacterium]